MGSEMCLHADPESEEGPVIAACNGNIEQHWELQSVPWK